MIKKSKVSSSRNPEVVKTEILDAAQAEFMAEGFAGASTNRIVERFGRSKPTLFRYFPTKRALFKGVVARIAARWSEQVDWRGISPDTPAVWLRTFAARELQWVLSEDNLFVSRMAVAEGHKLPEVGTAYRALAVEPAQQIIAERLKAWTKAGVLRCTDPARDAQSFLDIAISGLVGRRLYGVGGKLSDAVTSAHIDHAVEIFLRGTEVR
jgi:AcrR family transcriptional regulator